MNSQELCRTSRVDKTMSCVMLTIMFIMIELSSGFCAQDYSIIVYPKETKKVSAFLFGNNIEYSYNYSFFKLKDKLLSKCPGPVTVLRFPGGCLGEYYSWADGIGDKTHRPFGKYGPYFASQYSNTLGTKEIFDFCKKIRAESIFAVNVETGNVDMAKSWVAYCNFPSNSVTINAVKYKEMLRSLQDKKNYSDFSLDDFANLRSFNGDSVPYNVRFWEIGNEVYYSKKINADMYADIVLDYVEKMKSVAPDIKIGAVFSSSDSDWNDSLMKKVGQKIDFVSVHIYEGPIKSPPVFLFYSNNSISKKLDFKDDFNGILEIEASGTKCLGYPIIQVNLDGKPIEEFEVGSEMFRKYTVKMHIDKGTHIISVGFVNDFHSSGKGDRNVYLHSVTLRSAEDVRLLVDAEDEYYFLYKGNYVVSDMIAEVTDCLNKYDFKGDIAITEVNVNYGLGGMYDREQTMNAMKLKSAIYLAGIYNTFIRQGIWMANYWNLLTSGDYGFFTQTGDSTPPYLAAKIYSQYVNYSLLDVQMDSDKFPKSIILDRENDVQNVSYVDGIALINEFKTKVALILLNRHSKDRFKYVVDLSNFNLDFNESVKVRILNTKDKSGMEASNAKNPQNVFIEEKEVKIRDKIFEFVLDPHCVTSLEICLK